MLQQGRRMFRANLDQENRREAPAGTIREVAI
jgi:hypothetical protein